MSESTVKVDVHDGIATITLDRPRTLNSITGADYTALGETFREIDKRSDVIVTILQASGDWFCAGTDVKDSGRRAANLRTVRESFLNSVAPSNTDVTQALYSHSKILVAALNGPVMGIAAAFLGHFDFIYCLPKAWLQVPFTFLGIISEAGSSVSFVNRMGLAKANEVLIFGKKLDANEMLQCGFVNQIFPQQSTDAFHAAVRYHVQEQLSGLDPSAILTVKKLIQTGLNEKNNKDGTNMRETYEQAGRFASGIPSERFGKIARKEIKHKL